MGSRYYQEIAPDVAMDKSEKVSINETVNVPAGSFSKVINMKESSDLGTWTNGGQSTRPWSWSSNRQRH
jgi:hypothetical protein